VELKVISPSQLMTKKQEERKKRDAKLAPVVIKMLNAFEIQMDKAFDDRDTSKGLPFSYSVAEMFLETGGDQAVPLAPELYPQVIELFEGTLKKNGWLVEAIGGKIQHNSYSVTVKPASSFRTTLSADPDSMLLRERQKGS
jgi:hypothetical protein